jgi:hypothetical protein
VIDTMAGEDRNEKTMEKWSAHTMRPPFMTRYPEEEDTTSKSWKRRPTYASSLSERRQAPGSHDECAGQRPQVPHARDVPRAARCTRRFVSFALLLISGAALAQSPDSSALLRESRMGENAEFTALVQAGKYPEALAWTCRKFGLSCEDYRIRINADEVSGSYATTHPYTNTIRVNRSAFEYLGHPRAGWLAAILTHEIVHTRQSRYIRSIVIRSNELVRNFYWTATLEIEAWQAMLAQADKLQLTCVMKLEIEDQISYYATILGNGGHAPANEDEEIEHYLLPKRMRQAFENQCARDLLRRAPER